MKRFDKIKYDLYDLLIKNCTVEKHSNRLHLCHEISCDDCLFQYACYDPELQTEAETAIRRWLSENEKDPYQKQDIKDYIIEILAIDKTWEYEISACSEIKCSNCTFNKDYLNCSKVKEKWLDEDIKNNITH